MRVLKLSDTAWETVVDFFEETDALIDADDGTLFPLKYLDKFNDVKGIILYGHGREDDYYA